MFPAPRQRHVAALASAEAALAALDNEVLIVHGREDRVVPLESSIRMHRLIPRSQLHVFGRCGHWTQIEQNARFCRLVADFFGEQTA
jgi:2-hydroxymuconate-semialdehyde hydrolase